MLNSQDRIYTRGADAAIQENLERVGKFLDQLSKEKFYGVVELQFQSGELVLVRKQESFKPNFLVIIGE